MIAIVCSVQHQELSLLSVYQFVSLFTQTFLLSKSISKSPCLNFSLSLSSHLFFSGSDLVSLLLSISSLAKSLIVCLPEYFTLLFHQQYQWLSLSLQCEKKNCISLCRLSKNKLLEALCWFVVNNQLNILLPSKQFCVWWFAALLGCFKGCDRKTV